MRTTAGNPVPPRATPRALRAIVFGLVFTAPLALAACGADAAKGGDNDTNDTIVLQEYAGGADYLNYLTSELGNFEKAGIDVKIESVSTGPQAINAMLSGSIDAASVNPFLTAALIDQGKDLEVVAGFKGAYPALTGSKDMAGKSWPDSVAQLKGDSIGVLALGGADQAMCSIALAAAGVDSDEVTWEATGSGQATRAALTSGKIDAACAGDTHTASFEAQDYPVLFRFVDPVEDVSTYPEELQAYLNGFSYLQVWSTSEWAEAHEDLVTGLQKAYAMTEAWMQDKENLPEVVKILKASPYYLDGLTDDQYADYVESSTQLYQVRFTEEDAQLWQDIADHYLEVGLPDESDWVSDQTPRDDDAVAQLENG